MESCCSRGRHVSGRILVGGDRRRGRDTTISSLVFWRVGGDNGHSAVGNPMTACPGVMGGDGIGGIGGIRLLGRFSASNGYSVVSTASSSHLGVTGEG